MTDTPLLELRGLSRTFPGEDGGPSLRALDGLSLQIRQGESFGLVGESGSGKTTAARCIMNLLRPTGGQVLYRGADVWARGQFRRRRLQRERQLIFQSGALNPRMTTAELIAEPLVIHRLPPPRGTLREEAAFQLCRAGLDPSLLDRCPGELSGGQRQRVAIARALTLEPVLLVADEPVTGLDASVQAQILNLFQRLQQERGFTLLLISHDLAAVRHLCRRAGVLYQGRLVECGPVESLFTAPRHPYTQSLLSAAPSLEKRRRERFRPPPPPAPGGVWREAAADHWVLEEEP